MKIRRNTNLFENSRRRRRPPFVRIALAVLAIAVLILAWQRGGQQPQSRVEKQIPAQKLGQ